MSRPFTARFPLGPSELGLDGLLSPSTAMSMLHDAWELLASDAGQPLHERISRGDWGLPLAHVELEGLPTAPIEQLVVHVALRKASGRSIQVAYRLEDEAGRPAGRAVSVHVCIDRQSGRPIPLPEAAVAALAPYVSTEGAAAS